MIPTERYFMRVGMTEGRKVLKPDNSIQKGRGLLNIENRDEKGTRILTGALFDWKQGMFPAVAIEHILFNRMTPPTSSLIDLLYRMPDLTKPIRNGKDDAQIKRVISGFWQKKQVDYYLSTLEEHYQRFITSLQDQHIQAKDRSWGRYRTNHPQYGDITFIGLALNNIVIPLLRIPEKPLSDPQKKARDLLFMSYWAYDLIRDHEEEVIAGLYQQGEGEARYVAPYAPIN